MKRHEGIKAVRIQKEQCAIEQSIPRRRRAASSMNSERYLPRACAPRVGDVSLVTAGAPVHQRSMAAFRCLLLCHSCSSVTIECRLMVRTIDTRGQDYRSTIFTHGAQDIAATYRWRTTAFCSMTTGMWPAPARSSSAAPAADDLAAGRRGARHLLATHSERRPGRHLGPSRARSGRSDTRRPTPGHGPRARAVRWDRGRLRHLPPQGLRPRQRRARPVSAQRHPHRAPRARCGRVRRVPDRHRHLPYRAVHRSRHRRV